MRRGTIKRISVNREALKKDHPSVSVKNRGKTHNVFQVWIEGPSTVRHDPTASRQPRVWVETNATVILSTGEVLT